MGIVSKNKPAFILAAAVLFALTGIFILTGPRTKIDIDQSSKFLLASSVYYKDMKELDISNVAEHYSGITGSDISGAKVFVSTDGTTREFAVIKANSSQSADSIQSALGSYCCDLLQKYQTENSEEYERLRGYFIRRTRNYVILTISDSSGTGNQLVDAYFDKINYDKRA